MRIHAHSRHPNYWGNHLKSPPYVYLDGEKQDLVLFADDEAGKIVQYTGRRNPRRPDRMGIVLKRGRVEFKW